MSEIKLQQKAAYTLGIDVGSTTVKTVILDADHHVLHSTYQRHFSKVKEAVSEQLQAIIKEHPATMFSVHMTGSAGLGLATAAKIPFVQEVHAAFLAVKERYPKADAVIELGGEDAKIIFLTGGVEQRMNGSCAGGTGAFIDQMATLLDVTVDELDQMALHADRTYPIAARCGVFAKSDIQPLLNQGAKRENVAASIYQAVVDQTVSGLAQGRKIQGYVLFLGGPLSFLQGLRNAFMHTLHLDAEHAIFPVDGRTFVAYGCALAAENSADKPVTGEALLKQIESAETNHTVIADKPLFGYQEEYDRFRERHAQNDVVHGDLHTYQGKSLTPRDRSNQNSYVDMLLMITRLAPQKSSEKGIADDERGIGFAPQLDENNWNISTGNVYAEALGDGDMMSRMERQLEADLFGTSNTPEEIGGFGYFRSLTESLSPRDAMYYGRLIKVRDLLRQKRYTGDQETRNHYELLLHRIEGALQ